MKNNSAIGIMLILLTQKAFTSTKYIAINFSTVFYKKLSAAMEKAAVKTYK